MFQYSFVGVTHWPWDHHHQERLHHRGNTPRNVSTSDGSVSQSRHHPPSEARHCLLRLAIAPMSNEGRHSKAVVLVSM